jgi:predicted acylesterase/phospholipase RssA
MGSKRWYLIVLLFALLLLFSNGHPLASVQLQGQIRTTAPFPKVIRIAVPYYEDLLKAYNEYQVLFAPKRGQQQPFSIDIVAGTYDDVLYWYQNGMVDLAVLPPGAVADLLTAPDPKVTAAMRNKLQGSYLGSRSLIAGGYQPFLEAGRETRVRYKYRAYCIVPRLMPSVGDKQVEPREAVPINSFSDVIALAKEKKVRFLFVHPLSVSGRILPEYLLRRANIEVGADNVEWTYNHSLSLKRLFESKSGKINVAFIWDAVKVNKDGANHGVDLAKDLKKFPLSENDSEIPQEILVSTPKFKEQYPAFDLEQLIPGVSGDVNPSFKYLSNWADDYKELIRWTAYLKENPPLGKPRKPLLTTPFIDLDQIIARLRNYNKSHVSDHPLRLAVVLSGGGAKCAYQLGVMEALESKLRALQSEQRRNNEPETDISLVVGTSGGAINALAVALGLTRDEANRALLRDTWRSFTQRDFLELWPRVHIAFGIGIGVLQAAFVIFVCMMKVKWRTCWWSKAGTLLLLLSAVNLFVSSYPNFPYDLLGDFWIEHFWQHIWLVMTLSVGWSTLCLFTIGGTLRMLGWRMSLKGDENENVGEIFFNLHRRKIVLALLGGVTLTQVVWMMLLFNEDALSSSSALKNVVSHKFAELIVAKESVIAGAGDGEVNDLNTLSRTITGRPQNINDRPLLDRDLIITGSRLSARNEPRADEEMDINSSLPNDLYFFYANDLTEKKPDQGLLPDRRFISLQNEQNRGLLLDIVIGSSSIYPLFLPQKLCVSTNVAEPCRQIDLIDGGFVHNSPLEAAVKWDATHIIVIEASPSEQPTLQNGLMANSFTAFNYLFSQAQNLDAKMYGQKEIFIIRPDVPKETDEPNLDTFDFSPLLIDRAIDRGLNDALNVSTPHFHRVFAQPSS